MYQRFPLPLVNPLASSSHCIFSPFLLNTPVSYTHLLGPWRGLLTPSELEQEVVFLQSTKQAGEAARGTREPAEGAHRDFPRLVTSSEERDQSWIFPHQSSRPCPHPHHCAALPLPRTSPDIVHQQHRAIGHDRQITGIEVWENADIPDGNFLLGGAVQHCRR